MNILEQALSLQAVLAYLPFLIVVVVFLLKRYAKLDSRIAPAVVGALAVVSAVVVSAAFKVDFETVRAAIMSTLAAGSVYSILKMVGIEL